MFMIYNVTFNLTAFIIPMATQLSALIFGCIRHNKAEKKDRAKYITYFDPVVEYYVVTYEMFLRKE